MADFDVKVGVDISDVVRAIQSASDENNRLQFQTHQTITQTRQAGVQTEAEVYRVKYLADMVYKEARMRTREVIGMAQKTWFILTGALRATGQSVSTVSRVAVSAGLGAIDILTNIYQSMVIQGGWNPALALQGALGLASLAMSIVSIAQFEQEEKQLSRQMRGAIYALNGVNSTIYGWI